MLTLTLTLIHAYVPSGLRRMPAAQQARTAVVCNEGVDKLISGLADAFSGPTSITKAIASGLGLDTPFDAIDESNDDQDGRPTARASHVLLSFDDYPEGGGSDGVTGEMMGNALKEKILSGEYTFELVAEKFSGCPSGDNGGDLGAVKQGAMVPEFDAAVFDAAVPIGTIQGPIKTKFGHHLVKVVERSG